MKVLLNDTLTIIDNQLQLSQNLKDVAVSTLDEVDIVYKVKTTNNLEYYTLDKNLTYQPYTNFPKNTFSQNILDNAFIAGANLAHYSYRYFPVKDTNTFNLVINQEFKTVLEERMNRAYPKIKIRKCNSDHYSWKYEPNLHIWSNYFGYYFHTPEKFPIKLFNPSIQSLEFYRNFLQGYVIRRISNKYFDLETISLLKRYITIREENYYNFVVLCLLLNLNFEIKQVAVKSIPSWQIYFKDIETWNWVLGKTNSKPDLRLNIKDIETPNCKDFFKIIIPTDQCIYTPFFVL